MELEYLISCLALQYAPKQPSLLDLSYDDAVSELSSLSTYPLFREVMHLRSYQLEIRLFGQEDTLLEELPSVVQQHIIATLDAETLSDLSETLENNTNSVQESIQQFYQKLDHKRLKDWQEVNILWQ